MFTRKASILTKEDITKEHVLLISYVQKKNYSSPQSKQMCTSRLLDP